MPVPKRRHSKGRVRRKRNEKMQQSVTNTVACKSCGQPKLSHRICPNCEE